MPLWLRFLPLLVVVIAGVTLYVLTKRRGAVSYPPGRGLRIFDKDGNEIKGPLRIVTAVVLALGVIAVLAFVILPFTFPYP